jgi:PTS system beta-glucosides-specific IIC component
VLEVGHLNAADAVDEDGNAVDDGGSESGGKKSPVSMLIDVISGTLQPTLGVMAATGIIKGLLALFDFIGLIPSTSGTCGTLWRTASSTSCPSSWATRPPRSSR